MEILRVKGQASAAKRCRALDRRGRRLLLHPRKRQDRRAGRDPLRDRLRGVATTTSRRSPVRSPCTSPPRPPQYVSAEEVPADAEASERAVFEQKAAEEGKPENVRERIVEGQLAKWRKEIALLEQAHVNADKHEGKTIEQLRAEAAATTGENIRISRFVALRRRRGRLSGRGRRSDQENMSRSTTAAFDRVLLKLSGEALMGSLEYGTDPESGSPRIAETDRQFCQRHRPGDRDRRRCRQHLPRPAPAPPPAWTGRPPTTWACSPRCSTL